MDIFSVKATPSGDKEVYFWKEHSIISTIENFDSEISTRQPWLEICQISMHTF